MVSKTIAYSIPPIRYVVPPERFELPITGSKPISFSISVWRLWVLVGFEPYFPDPQSGALTNYATNTVTPRGFEPRPIRSKRIALPLG